MIGPSPKGLGGISRVVGIWEKGGIFDGHAIEYFPSVTDNNGNKFLFFFKSFLTYLWKLTRKPSLIFVHTSSHNSFFRKSFFILPAILAGHNIILHVHPSHFYEFFIGLNGFTQKYVQFCLDHIMGFIFLTEDMKDKFISIYPKKPMWILPNPVHVKALQNKHSISRKKNRILFLGWFIPSKGIYELVDAIEILLAKGYLLYLDFYGTKQIDKLKDYIASKNLEKNIIVHGWINDQEKIDVLYRSTMLVLPSYTEGLPNVILEAMATRTPIIATHVGGLRELLRNGENALIVTPKDPVDLSEKISFLLSNPNIRDRLAENAYRQVKEKYDISKIKQNFDQIIKDIIKIQGDDNHFQN